MRIPPSVPEKLARTTIALRGAAGAEWLNRLPANISRCEERCSLKVDPPFPEPSYNWATLALRADGTAAVLKLSFPNAGFRAEAEALCTLYIRRARKCSVVHPCNRPDRP